MKWLKEKPQTVTKLEQELHQVREQITHLKAREKELVSKLRDEESKQGALTRSKVTQAKLLAGALLMGLWEERLEGKEELRRHINERVTKQAERDLFGEDFWKEGGRWKVLDKKQERRRWIIVGALFLDLIDFEDTAAVGKTPWSEVRSFFNWSLERSDHRKLYGFEKLPTKGLMRQLSRGLTPLNLVIYSSDNLTPTKISSTKNESNSF